MLINDNLELQMEHIDRIMYLHQTYHKVTWYANIIHKHTGTYKLFMSIVSNEYLKTADLE